MNERIRELYRQAHGTRHYDGDPALDGNPPTVYWQGEASAQRFAQLIVRECALVAGMPIMRADTKIEPNVSYISGFAAGREEAESEILSHFGVEE